MRDNNKILSVIFRDNTENMHQKGINRLILHNNSLLSAGRDGIINQWNLQSLELEKSYSNHLHWVNDIVIAGSSLFSGSSDSRILQWQLDEENLYPKPINTIFAHKDYIHSLKCVGSNLFSAGEDGVLIRTDLESKSLKVFSSPISIWNIDCANSLIGLAFTSKVIYRQIPKVLDIRSPKTEIDLKGHSGYVRKIILKENEREILTCSSDHTVKLWDLGTRKVIESFNMHTSSVFALRCYWEQEVL